MNLKAENTREVAQQLRSHESNCFATKIAEFYIHRKVQGF